MIHHHGQMLEFSVDMLSPSDSSMKLPNFNQKALSTVATLWMFLHLLLISLALPISLGKCSFIKLFNRPLQCANNFLLKSQQM